MPSPSSPTAQRRRLAAALRRRRDQAGMTIEEVAGQLEWSPAKVSRIENARVSVLPRDVRLLLHAYGADEAGQEWQELVTLARGSRQKGWWHSYADVVPDWFATYIGLESVAASLRIWENEVVPGLFQTEDYARAITRAAQPGADVHQLERRVAVRMARQRQLGRLSAAPRLQLVLGEAVLCQQVGGRDVMAAQLARLASDSTRAEVTLQVLPFSAGAHPGMDGPFHILGFPDDPDVVYLRSWISTSYLDKPEHSAGYAALFDRLRMAALAPDPSRELVAAAAAAAVTG